LEAPSFKSKDITREKSAHSFGGICLLGKMSGRLSQSQWIFKTWSAPGIEKNKDEKMI